MLHQEHWFIDVGNLPLHVWLHSHACRLYPLYTDGSSQGGLGFSEADNGRIFALIGILGIITQGALIGPLARRFGSCSFSGSVLFLPGLV